MKNRWTDNLPADLLARLSVCASLKSDILPLAQRRWATIKEKPGFTKEDALVDVLELLDCNSQVFDLTRNEYDDILSRII